MYVLLIDVCPFVFFLLVIVLSVLSSIYGFWLPLCYLQTLRITEKMSYNIPIKQAKYKVKRTSERKKLNNCIKIVDNYHSF
jgi:hypothetical protein